ncbi:MAG: hypothetical protein JF888_01400 [Candidatus Dormibacteraeota bacterium]|uniref:Uncharacterized protein n=1 Tax=Candidatus Dormiibacter inghamiae TaxID=3127013 RepID=A0A934KEG9_9BACT|nr:hypothetical protein [Candidatus Dormibacteraeota bacterium]MBJ7605568.1 hypothetical protein [Candidatus Dormibacteraeota bacterium]
MQRYLRTWLAIVKFETECWQEAYRGIVPRAYLERASEAAREVRWRERLLARARQIALAELDKAVLGVVSGAH